MSGAVRVGRVVPLVAAVVAAGALPFIAGPRAGAQSASEEVPASVARAIGVADDLSVAFAHVAERVAPSVVNVRSSVRVAGPSGRALPRMDEERLREFFGDGFLDRFGGRGGGAIREGQGSGFIVDEDGHILTNNHVVAEASEVRVQLHDGREFVAEVVGTDPRTDLAVLRIEADGLRPLRFAEAEGVRVGEWVVAVGNPFGLESTITAGIVSAKGRTRVGITDYENFIQTDAAINPGNSGGPLVNLRGEVVGVNTAIATRTGGSVGVGFAIPSDLAGSILRRLVDDGVVVRGWLGVVIQDLDPGLARSFGFEGTDGVLISEVQPGGPADGAGLRAGDIVTAFNGRSLRSMDDLRLSVAEVRPGTGVDIVVHREGRERRLEVEVGEQPGGASVAAREPDGPARELGLRLEPLDAGLAERLGLGPDVSGVVVAGVEPLTAAARAGLRAGDIVTHADGEPVGSVRALAARLRAAGSDGVRLTVRTGESRRFVFLPTGG